MSAPFPPPKLRDRLHAATLVEGVSSGVSVPALVQEPDAWRAPDALSASALERWRVGLADPTLADRYLAECEALARRNGWITTPVDPDWPMGDDVLDVLRGIGRLPPAPRLGIVGSRKADPYGLEVAARLARSAVERGVTVVSGGALGIDVAAHRAALAAGGDTVVVLGAGLDHPSPRAHQSMFEAAMSRGALVSCFPCGLRAARWTFPKRNRWIAALSSALVVVQAGRHSGALSTADHALQMKRPVWVVPGPLDAPLHRGCHDLVARGAQVLTRVEDWAGSFTGTNDDEDDDRAPVQGRDLWEAAGVEPMSLAALARRADLSIGEAMVTATQLELSGWFRQAPGTRYARARPPRSSS